MLDGDAIFERKFPRNPELEGVLKLPSVRPRTGLLSIGDNCDLEGVGISWPGSRLESGLLSESLDEAGFELSDLRLDPGRDVRLAGLDGDLCGSSSKKFECEALPLRAGEEGRRASVSTVLSANDGRGFKLLARMISSPAPSSSMGLAWDSESIDPALDMFVMLALLPLANADCEAGSHCDEALLLRPGSFEAWDSLGKSCSGRVDIRSRGAGNREKPLLAGFGSFG